MSFLRYTTTFLEDLVTQWYLDHEFNQPDDLDIQDISLESQIFLSSKPTSSSYMKIGDFKEIVVDSRLPTIYQREQFFHELCHALRHAGRQSIMPKAFHELQERDAKHFTLYASLPFHMIYQYTLTSPNLIEQWKEDFKIPEDLCIERLKQINRRPICTSYNPFISYDVDGRSKYGIFKKKR